MRGGFGRPVVVGYHSLRNRATESVNITPCKVIKTREHFPSDEAALKLLYLGIRNMEKKWTRQQKCWNLALNQFSIMFEGRLPA